jgi:hypothetical protein
MSQAAEILTELQRRDVIVAVEGDTLCLKPRRALDDTLLARVRDSKPAILEVLRKPSTCWHCGGARESDCSTCGVMKPSVVWAAGKCVACKAPKTRVQ